MMSKIRNNILIIILLLCPLLLVSSCALGQTHEDGLDAVLKKDYETAYVIWKELAQQGNTYAMKDLGTMYARGHYVEKDMKKAIEWWWWCSMQYNFSCMTRMGYMHYKVPEHKNLVYSHFWYSLSSHSPNMDMKIKSLQSLDNIEKEMTKEQLGTAKLLFEESRHLWKEILN